ncbi:MAG: hypothetical protein WAW90_01220 [Minisyncoccia bacterium]
MKAKDVFEIVGGITLGKFAEKLVKDCFNGKLYAYCNADLADWFHGSQPGTDACTITALSLLKGVTFVELATALLGVSEDVSAVELSRLLIERDYTMSFAQIDATIEKTECRKKVPPMFTREEYSNLFFVETGDKDSPVVVVDAYRLGSRWYLRPHRFWRNVSLNPGCNHLLVRNFKGFPTS